MKAKLNTTTIEQIRRGSLMLANTGASLKEFEQYHHKGKMADGVDDHAADAFRYAVVSGMFTKREKKPNKWLIFAAIVVAFIILAISIMAIL